MAAKKPSAAFEATRLLGKWTRLAQGHVMFGSGCSCGVGSGTLRLQDFEPQILDYLRTKHGDTGYTAIAELPQPHRAIAQGRAGVDLAWRRTLGRGRSSSSLLFAAAPALL